MSAAPRVRAVLFDAVQTLIRPWPSVGAVYARAAAGQGLRCPARALQAAFLPAYGELAPERFFGRSGLQTSEPRERRWWARVLARTFEGAAAPRRRPRWSPRGSRHSRAAARGGPARGLSRRCARSKLAA